MAEHRDELLAQLGCRAFADQARLARRQPLARIEMKRDQLGEQLEHADRLGIFQAVRLGIDGAQRAEEAAVLEEDRHRDVALEAVHRRRVMLAVERVLGDVIDRHRLAALAYLVADGGLDLELAAGLQAEPDFVVHRAADPPLFGDARDRGEPHAGDPADDIQDGRDGIDGADGIDVRPEIVLEAHSVRETKRRPGNSLTGFWPTMLAESGFHIALGGAAQVVP